MATSNATDTGRIQNQLQPVSFVIPAHNEEGYLLATLESIQAAAQQLPLEFEIIVVDDDSNDRTAEIAQQCGAHVCPVALRNIGAVRNAGAKAAHHPWLIFVDADTLVPIETLQMTIELLASDYVGGGARVDLSQEQPISFPKRLMFATVAFCWFSLGRWAAGCYMFCRRNDFEDFGGFDERFFAAEELFFSRQLKKRGRFGLVNHPVITSARKLHSYSFWQLIRFLMAPVCRFWAPLRSPKGLEVLYQDDRRTHP